MMTGKISLLKFYGFCFEKEHSKKSPYSLFMCLKNNAKIRHSTPDIIEISSSETFSVKEYTALERK